MPIEDEAGFRPDPRGLDRPDRQGGPVTLIIIAVLVFALLAGWFWWSRHAVPASGTAPPAPPAAPVASAPAPAPAEPAIKYPMQPASQPEGAPLDITAALIDLLGRKAVATFVQPQDFPRRLVATVDSLGREHSSVLMWPVLPTPGRFTVQETPDGPVIAPENAARYTPLVLLVSTLDMEKVAALYRRMYPLLQQAYVELGFGKRYFNDRAVEVIDQMLAAPEPAHPPRVQLTEVKGPIPSERPWVRYEFADPQLESLTAGQKIMIRMGLVNERRLKTKLTELRKYLTQPVANAGR